MAKNTLNPSISGLSDAAKQRIIEGLEAAVATGLDAYSQVKVAHWNLKGANFLALHPFLDVLATDILAYNDTLAERAIILGGRMDVTVRASAQLSPLKEYPKGLIKDTEHAKKIISVLELYGKILRQAAKIASDAKDKDTEDMITVFTTAIEKHAWFLTAFTH